MDERIPASRKAGVSVDRKTGNEHLVQGQIEKKR